MTYGIANRDGQPAFAQVADMLRIASERGVRLLDTAHVYGEAEDALGAHGAASLGFDIVTKTARVGSARITEGDVANVSAAFAASLASLKCERVYGLLVHQPGVLLAEGGQRLWDALDSFKAEGLVGSIGVSVYDPAQLESLLDRYELDLVQLPLNIYDQRFMRSGLLAQLRQRQVEVHARSVFLQGLLLLPPDELPARFSGLCPHHANLHEWFRKTALSPLEGCLHFALRQPDVDRIIVGCETAAQLTAILDACAAAPANLTALHEFEVQDRATIDPSTWLQ